MNSRLLTLALLVAAFLWPAVAGAAEEGDPPSGPEACLVDGVNDRRSSSLKWSGVVQEKLRGHAAEMSSDGSISHEGMSGRTGDIPPGWTHYGETASVEALASPDLAGVTEWCEAAVDALWSSDSHRRILSAVDYEFMAVGVYWDGDAIWIATGVFAHPDYQPTPTDWPDSYAEGLASGWDGRFYDDDGNIFEADIEELAASGITRGCNPPVDSDGGPPPVPRFCPDSPVTRGQMAAFLSRAFDLSSGDDMFRDDDGSVFESDIDSLGRAGVTEGCNPPRNDRFCPDRPITRAEMATFLGRALNLQPSSRDAFSDTAHSVHRQYMNALAEAGITVGCDTASDRFCPEDAVTRGQMAAFLVRAGVDG
ncbi:MAG TPA: S-layer homology domain-containing protein [Acidimicrobiia bacterium]|nr:S-layer homology domain-containing protein [Acidimicrobiia bacterium]